MDPEPLPVLDKRIVRWDMHDLQPRDCPVCADAGSAAYIRPDKLHVRLCNRCGLYFVSPAPSAAQLTRFYAGYDTHHRNARPVSGAELLRTYRRADPNADYRYQALTALMDFEGRRVLDVGFGRGFFLYYLKKLGAQVTGLELDDQAIQYARQYLGIPDVSAQDLLDVDPGARFDAILMMDLIEHVREPFRYLEKAAALLNPGGIIALFTPNASYAPQQQAPVLFRVDLEHMQYFSGATMNHIAGRLGLHIVHLETTGYPYLTGLVEPAGGSVRLKRLLWGVPGVKALYRIRKKLTGYDTSRTGRYHLFCVLGKPAV